MTVAALALYQMSAALLQSLLGPSLPPGPGYARVISAGTFVILSVMLLVPWQLPPASRCARDSNTQMWCARLCERVRRIAAECTAAALHCVSTLA